MERRARKRRSIAMDLPRMQPNAHGRCKSTDSAVFDQGSLDLDRTADRRSRFLEGNQKSVPGMVHLAARVTFEVSPKRGVMPAAQVSPGSIADDGDERRGPDDVREHHREVRFDAARRGTRWRCRL